MSNELGLASPALPAYFLYPVALLSLLIILFVMARVRDRAGAFVIGASWLRYVMSAFHTITYRPLAAGMSANALASMGLVVVGLMNINLRHLQLRFLLPFYVLMALAVVSAIANGGFSSGLVTVISKHAYLMIVILSVYGAMTRARGGDFMASMLWSFLPVFIWQLISIAFGYGKMTETDVNSMSYIGGYNHEAAFSVTLATCLTAACFATGIQKQLKFSVIVICVVGIFLANYRTTLVAIAPLLITYLAASSLGRFPLRDRPFVASFLIVAGALTLGILSLFLAERFNDVTVAGSGDVNFFKPPSEYTVDEGRLLSGRPYIWSSYFYAWLRGDLTEYVIGFGPESWNDAFPLYAHNTLVNYLYEYGVVGVVVILWVWMSMLVSALRVRHPQGGVLVGAHLSYIVLNMATMPMWMVEGNILYGLICGYTLYLLSLQRKQPQNT
ncbi:MAG: O-antigen ligase family protein [Alphaproteobacteria bacterium]|nr:O-antigen ligase family protein [Alphaproteobacteria bacterium]